MASIDDVLELLKAVNIETLGRMEGEIKDLQRQDNAILEVCQSLHDLLQAVNETTLGHLATSIATLDLRLTNTFDLLQAVNQVTLDRMEREISGLDARLTNLQQQVQILVNRP